MDLFSSWSKEQEFLKTQQLEHPELFVTQEHSENRELLATLGIVLPGDSTTPGYLRYDPFDFIVEEILSDGSVSTVDWAPTQDASELTERAPVYFADLVKIRLATLNAQKELARIFSIDETAIGTSGMKDSNALTSQRISIRGATAQQILSLEPANFFLKNIVAGKGALQTGGLLGNRFYIFVRTPESISLDDFTNQLKGFEQYGFWNFYWLQRFGNRLLSHWWGLLLLRGEYEEVVRSYCCDHGTNDLPFNRQIRDQARVCFGDWPQMAKVLGTLPHTLRHEIWLVEYLIEHPGDYAGALNVIPEQIKLWVYAYSSYLFNRMLSSYVTSGAVAPQQLPLLLSMDPNDRKFYEEYLRVDNVPIRFESISRTFRFIRFASRAVDTHLRVDIHKVATNPQGVGLMFDLGKGSYATTFLAHLFTLTGGYPIPSWIKKDSVDLKELLEQGNLGVLREKFEKYNVRKEEIVDSGTE